MRVRHVVLLASLVGAVACGTSTRARGFDETPAPVADAGTSGPSLDIADAKTTTLIPVTLKGTVYAPNGSLPMARTLVYLTYVEPAPIPAGVYCDECVTLDPGTFAISAADGTFEIATEVPLGDVWLVVQKGQFRRARKFTVEQEGELDVQKADLTLPGRPSASGGDVIPTMAILGGASDDIGTSLDKLGITAVSKKARAFIKDKAALMTYQVIFIPCDDSTDPLLEDQEALDNLRAFVAAGGRLYVTDWSYEFVRQPFPGFITWESEGPELGSAAGAMWSAPAEATDTGLADWLAATGHPTFEVEGNWTKILGVNTVPGTAPNGDPIDVTPKVWVSAGKNGERSPTTVSFENQCGRVLFSTYHTEDDFGSTLHAQEKALLYALLEVGVCVGSESGVK